MLEEREGDSLIVTMSDMLEGIQGESEILTIADMLEERAREIVKV